MEDYNRYEDRELIALVRKDGNEEVIDFILNKYKGMVRRRARGMFLIGGENDDLIQEGMIGLFKAIRDFDGDKGVPFGAFAEICIARQMYTAVEAFNRKKHKPLNSYLSLSGGDKNGSEEFAVLGDVLESRTIKNPEEVIIDRESVSDKIKRIHERLSSFELKVLDLFLEGDNYVEIGEKLDKSAKSIDNALQRIKQKIQEKI
jgi:RNA polymerase sporulation-specific sigma factor